MVPGPAPSVSPGNLLVKINDQAPSFQLNNQNPVLIAPPSPWDSCSSWRPALSCGPTPWLPVLITWERCHWGVPAHPRPIKSEELGLQPRLGCFWKATWVMCSPGWEPLCSTARAIEIRYLGFLTFHLVQSNHGYWMNFCQRKSAWEVEIFPSWRAGEVSRKLQKHPNLVPNLVVIPLFKKSPSRQVLPLGKGPAVPVARSQMEAVHWR